MDGDTLIKQNIKCICTIIGIIIGAGFASGKEIYLFFNKYNSNGLIGIIIASLILGTITYKSLYLIKKYNIQNYEELLKLITKNKFKNKKINKVYIIKMIVNVFLLISFFIMIAGFTAYIEQELGINKILGSTIIAFLCYITFNKDIEGIVKISLILIPIIITFIIILGTKNLEFYQYIKIETTDKYKWIISAILYASYNTITLITVLPSLKKYIKNKRQLGIVSISISVIIMLLATIIYAMLLKIDININSIELPTIYVVAKYGIIYKKIFGTIILGAIYTTAISSGYGFLENISKNKKQYDNYSFLICSASIPISTLGFSNMVAIAFPVFGVLGLIQIILLIFKL